ncbi:hypothetical protein NMY22_g6416 [Coprinellus aureogranulatus]|nr:hypothetical protein NMY22_g6416 [Coprinellus aureogranulatus]
MSSHSSNADHSAPITDSLPDQGKFTKEEKAYLKEEWLGKYLGYCEGLDARSEGPRKTKGVKGGKVAWSDDHVYPAFIAKFYPVGSNRTRPNAESLKDVRGSSTPGTGKKKKAGTPTSASDRPVAKASAAPKAPRPTTAVAIFAKESDKVKTAMNDKRKEDGESVQQANLKNYHALGKALFEELPEEERAEFERRAATHNEAVKGKPPADHIQSNQAHIDVTTMKTLQSLIGDGWGQHGDVVYFTMGAFRDRNSKLQTFNLSVGPESAQVPRFTDHMQDYKNRVRQPFKDWASKLLPEQRRAVETEQHSQSQEGVPADTADEPASQPDTSPLTSPEPSPGPDDEIEEIVGDLPALNRSASALPPMTLPIPLSVTSQGDTADSEKPDAKQKNHAAALSQKTVATSKSISAANGVKPEVERRARD